MKILGVKAEQERAIKVQMKRQLEAAEDYLHDAMEAKEKEMARKTQRLIDEKVEIERNSYKTKLAEMVGRMQGVEAALSSNFSLDNIALTTVTRRRTWTNKICFQVVWLVTEWQLRHRFFFPHVNLFTELYESEFLDFTIRKA